jgi:hypothetical protein
MSLSLPSQLTWGGLALTDNGENRSCVATGRQRSYLASANTCGLLSFCVAVREVLIDGLKNQERKIFHVD